jgi:hypothetical protein
VLSLDEFDDFGRVDGRNVVMPIDPNFCDRGEGFDGDGVFSAGEAPVVPFHFRFIVFECPYSCFDFLLVDSFEE